MTMYRSEDYVRVVAEFKGVSLLHRLLQTFIFPKPGARQSNEEFPSLWN